ncbi:MAG: hypothetical protein KGK07_02350 [Chloroflexota bacterium]|nr:hypothetical protein [Chloroflexota bacterium]
MTFLVLLFTASVALTSLVSVGARMRAGDLGPAPAVIAAASFLALAVAGTLLLRIMFVLSRPAPAGAASRKGVQR